MAAVATTKTRFRAIHYMPEEGAAGWFVEEPVSRRLFLVSELYDQAGPGAFARHVLDAEYRSPEGERYAYTISNDLELDIITRMSIEGLHCQPSPLDFEDAFVVLMDYLEKRLFYLPTGKVEESRRLVIGPDCSRALHAIVDARPDTEDPAIRMLAWAVASRPPAKAMDPEVVVGDLAEAATADRRKFFGERRRMPGRRWRWG